MINCTKCNQDKESDKFYPDFLKKNYLVCKACDNARRNKQRQSKKENNYNTTGFDDLAQQQNIDNRKSKFGWLKTKEGTIFFTNPNYEDSNFSIENIDFAKLIGEIKPIKINLIQRDNLNALFDRLVISDVHVGMDCESGGFSLYDLKWNKEILFKRLQLAIEHVLDNQKSNKLIIHDLGDFLDGYEKRTTRGGHTLSQNLSTQDQFDVGLKFKITLIESLLSYYKEIEIVNICNDNHAGAFAYLVNSALKTYCDKAYSNVNVINQRKFIDIHIYNKYCFLLCHGKDDTDMKFGFKPKIDFGQINKITNFITANNLLNKGYKIEFSKGDSHQYIFDNASSDEFNYYNYPALSPSSNWVQTNFKKGESGLVFFNYWENKRSVHDLIFD